jgi:hypothetical protein
VTVTVTVNEEREIPTGHGHGHGIYILPGPTVVVRGTESGSRDIYFSNVSQKKMNNPSPTFSMSRHGPRGTYIYIIGRGRRPIMFIRMLILLMCALPNFKQKINQCVELIWQESPRLIRIRCKSALRLSWLYKTERDSILPFKVRRIGKISYEMQT